MPGNLISSDIVILNSVDSYLLSTNPPKDVTPQQMVIMKDQARTYLYSDIIQRMPRVVNYIISNPVTANPEDKDRAEALYTSLCNHCMDPVFVNMLMQYLHETNNPEDNALIGAFLAKIVSSYTEKKIAEAKTVKENEKPKKGEKPVAEKPETDIKIDTTEINHIYSAVRSLLGNLAEAVKLRCGNLEDNDVAALSIAACIALNDGSSIREICESDLPITAQVFDLISNPTTLIRSALLLPASEFTKLTPNQEAFMSSLKDWVFKKLNELRTQTIFDFLVSTYGTAKLDEKDARKYYIFLRDCGTTNSNLLIVAKQIIN